MSKILGLDLGTNSIGCTLRDTSQRENQIVFSTVLTFDKGVGEEKGVEVPLVQQRTMSRSKRRNYNARRYRKWQLLETLIKTTPPMCPLTMDELNRWRKYDNENGNEYPSSPEFLAWIRLDFDGDNISDFINPYELRALASKQKINNPLILGRIFYHITQRRGFKGRDEAESETILKGSDEKGIAGADTTLNIMKDKNVSLSEALLIDHNENIKRIRNRYSLRKLVEEELKSICLKNEIDIESELYKNLAKSILWQRPLRTQKGNIGKCTFEINKPRCPISHPLFEEYRALAFLNNIKITNLENNEEQNLSLEEKEKIISKLFLRKSKPTFDFSEIMKLIDPNKNQYKFNFKDYVSVSGMPVTAALKELFGCNVYEISINKASPANGEKSYYDYEDLWHVLYTFTDSESLIKFAKSKLQLSDEDSVKFSKIKIPQGFAALSINAIMKILKYLHQGYIYSDAVFLANLSKVLDQSLTSEEEEKLIANVHRLMINQKSNKNKSAIINNLISNYINNEEMNEKKESSYISDDALNKLVENEIINVLGNNRWIELGEQNQNHLINEIRDNFKNLLITRGNFSRGVLYDKVPRFDDQIKTLLKKEYPEWDEERFKYLYHPAESEFYPAAKEIDGKKILGSPEPISKGLKNPMALKTLYVLKKLINHLILTEKIDSETRVVVEIARELNDANRRAAYERWKNERQKENESLVDKITQSASEAGYPDISVDDNILTKYKLWLEQGMQCLYTGKVIAFSELLNGTSVDIEHTIPASISFDNELSNLTLANSRYNRDIKKKLIPTQLPNYNTTIEINGESYKAILPNIKFIENKVKHYSKLVEDAKKKSKSAQSKDQKDTQIQNRHYYKMHYDYWNKKLRTFTDTEIRNSWKNSQLVDTQIISKYAFHYLKTVFNIVDVQKGSVTAAFREIFNLGFKKDRNSSIHHAIDAATLTLIPYPKKRDYLLLKYFEATERKLAFHTKPEYWNNFSSEIIKDLEQKTFVNYYKKDTTLVQTYKNVRKRGRIQYVKKQLANGKFEYILDDKGNRIPMVAQGDTIRGQLHEETFLGAIKLPINNTGIRANYKIEKKPLIYVFRKPIKSFTKIEELKSIIDDKVRNDISQTINERIALGKSFTEAINEDIWMKDSSGSPIKQDKNGRVLFPIRHVRCVGAIGRGILTSEKALPIKQHSSLSKQEYKQNYYAKNEEITVSIFYEKYSDGILSREFRLIGLFELAQLKINNLNELSTIPEYNVCEKKNIPSKYFIKTGYRVIVYENSPDELRELKPDELIKRIYRVYKFNNAGTNYIYLQYNSEARQDKELGVGSTEFKLDEYQPRLKLTANNFNCLVEHYDFDISIDGEIIFK